MLARLARALLAEVVELAAVVVGFLIFRRAGDETCSDVVRRLLRTMFAIPSDTDWAGDGDGDEERPGLEAIRLRSSLRLLVL